jgi:hypothetical protein
MGGTIVLRMAERSPSGYQGVLAVSAPNLDQDPQPPARDLTFNPKMPVLFLAPENELAGPRDYIGRAAGAAVVPALWSVQRPGHLNVNQRELLDALRGLIAWSGGTRPEPSKDVTHVEPRSAEMVEGRVIAVNRRFGNLTTTFTTADMDRLGVRPGSTVRLRAGDRTFSVRYATSFDQVKPGEWVALAQRTGLGESQFEDNLTIAQNGGNAAEASAADVGAMLQLEAADAGPRSR